MNHTTKRAFALYFLIVAFLAGVVILTMTFIVNGGVWASNRANRHVFIGGQTASAGAIYDRNGEVLAKSVNGKRVYNDSRTIRKATLHVVGDAAGFISTGIHSAYKEELSGYSLVNGVYMLKKYGRGNDIHLTIDADVCAAAYNALNGRKGTVGVYNYKTGEILCMVSTPTFDIEHKPDDIIMNSEKYEGVYLNRFLSGVYTPGSTFKVFTAACAIENIPDIYSRTFVCTGKLQTSSGVIICNAVHGKVTFEQALNKSCNSAFAQIAIELGNEKLAATVNTMGFNNQFNMNGINIAKSTFNVSNANSLDLGWAGIGQYNTLANPYNMLTVMGAIANGGTGISPFLVDRIVSPTKTITQRGSLSKKTLIEMNSTTAGKLKELLRSNVENQYGDSRFQNLQMCGKTGTAEVGDGEAPHAWFVGFSERTDMPYAIVAVIENGGSGSIYAIPVANRVMRALIPG
ncbi:MAG: penicillin-binding transpeptidase domain-containing protein [Eubacteriales bacterium]